MDNSKLVGLKARYDRGENIIAHLKESGFSDSDAIMFSYDLQSGNYRNQFYKSPDRKEAYCEDLARDLETLGAVESLLHVGVGECITLANVLSRLKNQPKNILGLDIAWSRLKHGRLFCAEQGVPPPKLFVADLFRIPLPDNSVDVILSNHSLEPNGGRELAALRELARVAKKILFLNEPSYEVSDIHGRERMDHLGYVKNLKGSAEELNLKILEQKQVRGSINTLNPTERLIIDCSTVVNENSNGVHFDFICPVSGERLKEKNGFLCSKSSPFVYPILDEIPCLLADNAIVASHYAQN